MPVSATPDPTPEAKSWEQCYELGRRRFAEGDAAGAEQAFRDAITAAETPGGDPLQLASSLSSLGQLKYQQKDYSQAEDCFKRSLKLRESVLGRDHPVVISGINNLAASYVARGALDDAEPLLQRAMTVTVKRVEATQAELSVNLNNLVRLYVKRGDYARAEPLLTQLLSLKRPLGPEHPDVAAVLVTLAKLRFSMGRPADAERLWRRVLTVREKVLPPGDLIIAGTIDGLADTCAAQDKRAEELEFRERALAVREATLGAAHPSLDPMRLRITELRRALGNQPARVSVPVRVPETPKPRASPVTGAVAGLRRQSPIAAVQSPSGIPDFDMGTSPTPAVHAATMRTSGGKAIDQRSPILAVAPSLPTPSAVKWIDPSHIPPQPAARPPRTDRRSSRRLNLTKHREPETSGRTKFLWFSLVLLAAVGTGAFVYGRDLWSSVRSPLPAALGAVGHQATPTGSHGIAPSAATAPTAAPGTPAPPAAPAAAGAPAATTAGTPAGTPAATPSTAGPTLPSAAQPTAPSASPSATDPSTSAPGAAAGITASPTAQPAPVKPAAAPPTRPAAVARPVTVPPLVTAPRHPAVITSSIPHFSPATPPPPVHERKPAATSAAPVAPVVDIPNASLPSVDVDAATRTVDDAAKPQTPPSSPP